MKTPVRRHTHAPLPDQPRRRRVLQWGAAGAGLLGGSGWVRAQPAGDNATESPSAPRLALLIGNREYPEGDFLPPIHKNVHDLSAALQQRGFKVTEALDLDLAQAGAAMQAFAAQVRAAPPDATVLFYFSGHGAQVDAENLLVSARTSPRAQADVLVRNSLVLSKDVIGQLPRRPAGLTIAIVDACRTSLRDVVKGEGLNQVEAPPGCLIAFATGAGRPAISPADDKRNTFYTASLVKLLASSSDDITFSDLFRLVKYDVQDTMLNHPVALLRQFAQYPFIAENTQVRRRLSPAPPPPPRVVDDTENEDWSQLEGLLWPADVERLASSFLEKHPESRRAGSAQVALKGARDAATILHRKEVGLYRSSFQARSEPALLAEIAKAGRGDKDAAARIARLYGRTSGAFDIGRYEGWLQYATALDNGIASYELALHYRRSGQPLLASQYEARARELGYTPPPSLDNSRK
jgi:hypothetical protein